MTRWAAILFLALFLGCSSSPVKKTETIAEMSHTEYKIPHWATISQLEQALRDDKRPDYVLLSSMRCTTCRHLHQIMDRMGWSDKVLFVNLEEEWVMRLTRGVNLRIIPTMVVTMDGGGKKTVAFPGLESITTALFEQFSKKRRP